MDIPRPTNSRAKKIRRLVYGSLSALVLGGTSLGLAHLRPAAPAVDRASIYMDTVKRGEFVREVRGLGTLVPVEIRWIPAQSSAHVEKILLQSGAAVTPDSVILELSDAQLQREVLDANYAYKAAEAELANLKAQLANSLMAQKSAAADVEIQFQQAKIQADVDRQLFEEKVQSEVIAKKSTIAAQQLAIKEELSQQQLKVADEAAKAQIAAEQAHLDQQRVLYELKKTQLDALQVRAGISGVISAVSVDVGQQVSPGANLVRVADPSGLKATLQIAETQAKDIQIGQLASVDTHNGIANARVTRVDAAVVNGSVSVDLSFADPLPLGARPDLSVDGTIKIEDVSDVLFVGRPMNARDNGTVGLYKITDTGEEAIRTTVRLGRTSVDTVEILQGLAAGDRVILSDTAAWDTYERIRLR